jgi:hypothetical protein
MTLIERCWVCQSPDPSGRPGSTPFATWDPASADWYRERGWTVVEFVPAAPRGAVDALRFYADEANYVARNPPGSGAHIWRDHGQRARNALGGQ